MRSIRSIAAALSRAHFKPAWIPALAGLVLLAHLWRTTYGIDFGDGAHAVSLAVRLAQGDQPFADEMNAQVLGAWPAVPFTWVWLVTVGMDGIVLASRVFYVLLVAACAFVAWRALAPHLGRGVTAGALAVATIPSAYNLQVVSYNTTPALLLLLAVSAAVAAQQRSSLRWSLVTGVCGALAGVSHPVVVPAAAALLLVALLLGPRTVRLGILAGAAGVAIAFGAAVIGVWGVSAVTETLAYTSGYQAQRTPFLDRLERGGSWYSSELSGLSFVAALLLGLVAAVPRAGRWRVPVLLLAVELATVRALQRGTEARTVWTWSWMSPILALGLLLVLAPAAVSAALARRRGPLPHLLGTGLVTTAVGVPFVTAMTSSTPVWGAFAVVLPPGLLAVTAGALTRTRARGQAAAVLLTAALVGSLALVHAGTNFRQKQSWALDQRVTHGAFAGLATNSALARPTDRESVIDVLEHTTAAVQSCGGPGDGLLTYGFPTGHLLADRRFDTPMIWLGSFGPANEAGLEWILESDRTPECVVVSLPLWRGRDVLGAHDPLLRWIDDHYVPVSMSGAVVVLAPDPARPPVRS